jgi:hypothetical protein
MRKFMNIINEVAARPSVRMSFEQHGIPTELHDERDIMQNIQDGRLTPQTMVTVYRGAEERPTLVAAGEVPEITKHMHDVPEAEVAATATPEQKLRAVLEKIVALRDGYSTANGDDLYNQADRMAREALAKLGHKKLDT